MITYYPVQKQNKNSFNGGEIQENQPVVYTPGGSARPFSNLFYWAHATGQVDSLLGEHPHQGFEILSFVLKGKIVHYDTANRQWIPLQEGDVQVIRSGSGISHAEQFTKDSSIFQIWFDPDLNKSLRKKASYNDYHSSVFPVYRQGNFTIKEFKGEGSPMELDTEGVVIREIAFEKGSHSLDLDPAKTHSLYLLEGSVLADGKMVAVDDFLVVKEQDGFQFSSSGAGKWFIISTPLKPSYQTYAQMQGI